MNKKEMFIYDLDDWWMLPIGKDTDPFMILVAHTEDYQDNYPE